MDAKQETENQIHELNSEFIGPIVCAGQLWIQSFCIPVKKKQSLCEQTMQRNLSKVLGYRVMQPLRAPDKQIAISTLSIAYLHAVLLTQ